MYKDSFVHRLTKVLIDIMFYVGIACCVAAPFIMPKLAGLLGYSEALVLPLTIILLSSGLCALYILWQLKAMFKTLLGIDPFVAANVVCLRKCSVASFLIAIIYTVKIILWFTIASSTFVIIFALLGLFCLTLKDVFKQAIELKEKSDWTQDTLRWTV
jgi:hypothetical protein